jgi:hypothetical protein
MRTLPTLEDIATYSERLKLGRDALAGLLTQQILQGGKAYVLPATASSIREQRNEIARIKAVLRSWNIAVDNHPDDDPSLPIPTLPPEPEPAPDVTPEPVTAPPPRWPYQPAFPHHHTGVARRTGAAQRTVWPAGRLLVLRAPWYLPHWRVGV